MPECPHCNQNITPTQLRSLLKHTRADKRLGMAGDLLQAKRKTRGGGRKPSPDRCPCGKFTTGRAAQRNHKCTGPAPAQNENLTGKKGENENGKQENL